MKYRDADGNCLVCKRRERHLHTVEEVQTWERAVERSMSRHPSRRRLTGRLRPVESPER